MKQDYTHRLAMQKALSVHKHRGTISELAFTGSISPFVRVVVRLKLLCLTHFKYEIRREPIRIARIVIVGVAVGIDITKIVRVVVIR